MLRMASLLVCFISESRCLALYFVEEGTLMTARMHARRSSCQSNPANTRFLGRPAEDVDWTLILYPSIAPEPMAVVHKQMHICEHREYNANTNPLRLIVAVIKNW